MKLENTVSIINAKKNFLHFLNQGDLFLHAKNNTAPYKCYMVLQNNRRGKVDVVNLIDSNLTVLPAEEIIIPMNGSLNLSVPGEEEEDELDFLPF